MDKCPRCAGNFESGSTMSMFNTEIICMACKNAEIHHTSYAKARKAEAEEVKRGNYNFKGIGCPRDLYRKEQNHTHC